ncbi:glycogen debranching protein GlgX [Mesorhizobium sp. IMUNJ 23232]|uniref:glycogen debranching protein GlgX n=1 Tax=Mesorhizobium sp. IMUNJ 23232 TaxID=3376064 RepID=UPI0037B235C7
MDQKSSVLAEPRFGARPTRAGVDFSVWSASAERIWLCLFDGDSETGRIELRAGQGGVFSATVPGLPAGARYGFRAEGPYAPDQGLWFDPDKLLMDPYAVAIDRPYAYDMRLALKRGAGGDTAALMPKAVVTALPEPVKAEPPLFSPGGLIYEVQVRAFSKLHPDVPEKLRGTIAALAHPAVIDHLLRLNVSAVELMPVTAWIDERHLGPLGLTNAWGYNPVSFMALDPRIAPGGIAELRETVAALRKAGIGVILDLVFNHTGESDEFGPTLSLRGLDNQTYYRYAPDDPGKLVNDTGTGNTLACDRPVVRELVLDSLRHFVRYAGVDGFRFDLAPILGRNDDGFNPDAPLLRAMREDAILNDRVMIAEPWDIGPDGYQLGNFPAPFLEWNDRFRDDIRRFWRRDRGMVGTLATRLAGSSDVFKGVATRTVNFLAAHDGFSLADLVAYERKHNEANGEMNRDGHNENFSWNNGIEGETADAAILAERRRDLKALLATLFFSRGTIMLTAGDEFGRSQQGNNNAYAQDNPISWLDWRNRDKVLEEFAFTLAAIRRELPTLRDCTFLTGRANEAGLPDVEWLTEVGRPMAEQDWNDGGRSGLTMVLAAEDGSRIAIVINGDRRATAIVLPDRAGFRWTNLTGEQRSDPAGPLVIAGRTCACFVEKAE